jgi:exopolysaccharide production protein ExoQ
MLKMFGRNNKDQYHVDNFYVEETAEPHPIYGIAAKVAFFFFVFFVFYGTKLPFRERSFDVSDIGTSNIVNQIAFSTIFILAAFSLIPKLRQAADFLIREKLLTIFILWCMLSILWSDFPIVAFKRWFQIFTAFITIVAVFQYVRSADDLLKFFSIQLSIFIFINIFSVFTVPLAKDDYGEWRGIATSKNFLGQAALACSLIFIFAIRHSKTFLGKLYYSLAFVVAGILVFGANSSTSMLTFLIIVLVWFLFWVDRQFKALRMGRVITYLTLLVILSISYLSVRMIPHQVNAALGLIGEDLTFTGRTEIWEDMMMEIRKHPVLGTGYQTFWVVGNPDLVRIYDKYIWLPNQAHNGYVDIWNEVGIIGLFMVAILIIWYMIQSRKLKYDYFWKWFFIAAIIINFQESTLFRPGVLSGIMFMFAYLGLFKEIDHQQQMDLEDLEDSEVVEFVEEYEQLPQLQEPKQV